MITQSHNQHGQPHPKAKGHGGKLFCADSGRPYMVKVASNYSQQSYSPTNFYLMAIFNYPALPAGFDSNLTAFVPNASNGIIPLFMISAGFNSGTNSVSYSAFGSIWGCYHGQGVSNTIPPTASQFNPVGVPAFSKLYPYVSQSNNNFSNNVAVLWSQISWNETDFVDMKGGGTVTFSTDYIQGVTGYISSASTINASGSVTNLGFSFMYLELV